MKEWTVLIFLNGNNNLESYAKANLLQMEKAGPPNNTNVVIQWAALSAEKTKRILLQKNLSPGNEVISPSVSELAAVDMGNYLEFIDFIKWGVETYPAKHYFVEIWNHGSGWHSLSKKNPKDPRNFDISLDERTGHSFSTLQLAEALKAAQKLMGHKIEIFAPDACLMAMSEIAAEISSSVKYFAATEDVESARGWPYEEFFQRWQAQGIADAATVSRILMEQYIQSYSGGSNGTKDVNFSVIDEDEIDKLLESLKSFSGNFAAEQANASAIVKNATDKVIKFTSFPDYVDLGDFLSKMKGSPYFDASHSDIISALEVKLDKAVLAVSNTGIFAGAKGLSIWMPTSQQKYFIFLDRYQKLRFDQATQWHKVIELEVY